MRDRNALEWSARLWLLVAFLGQCIFVVYILVLYSRAAASGDAQAWNRVMPHGYVPGETLGNLAAMMHVFLGAGITTAGMLQMIPRIRQRVPGLHRLVGRLYMGTAFTLSLGGLFMVWVRGSVGDLSQHVAISLNGAVIMVCAAVAWRLARQRRLAAHRRWAVRLFLAASGVWFFRISLMFWLFVNGGPAGFDPESFTGPALTLLAFAQFLVPLAVWELYLRAQERGGPAARWAVAAGIGGLTLVTGLGVFAATMGMWLPRLGR
jgi:uncharacterized membrane protein